MGKAKIIVTGFEPFGGEKINPAAEVASALDGVEIAPEVRIETVIVPVTWGAALDPLVLAAERVARNGSGVLLAVVMLGQAGGYPATGLERVAVNVAHGKDNVGEERTEQPIVAAERGGPAAYLSTLPLEAIQGRIEAAGLPVFISNTAGTYLCNFLFYGFMHYLATAWPLTASTAPAGGLPIATVRTSTGPVAPVPVAGFVHLPYLPEQAIGKRPIPPSMSRADIGRSVRLALEAAAAASAGRTAQDIYTQKSPPPEPMPVGGPYRARVGCGLGR